jgi:hypothetical protein
MGFVKITCITENPVYYTNKRRSNVALVSVFDKNNPLGTLKKIGGNHPFMFIDLKEHLEDLHEISDEFNIEDWEFQLDYSNTESDSYLVAKEEEISEEEYANLIR